MGDVFESKMPEKYYVDKISDLEFKIHQMETAFKQPVKYGDAIVTVKGGMVQGLDATEDFPEGAGVVILDLDNDDEEVIPYYASLEIHETNNTLDIMEEITKSYEKFIEEDTAQDFKEAHDEYYNRK